MPVSGANPRALIAELQNGAELAEYDTSDVVDQKISSYSIGVIFDHGGAVAPANALVCDGALLAIEDYPSLFAAIGTTWEGVGGGDGITTFNLPLLTDRVTRAAGTAAVGELQEDQNKSHNHTASTNSAGSHTHSVSGTAASAGNHSHSVRTSNDGSGTSVGWRTGGSSTVNNIAGAALAAGAHTHGVSGSAASSGAHSHTVTVNSDGGAEVRVKAGITLKCIWAK